MVKKLVSGSLGSERGLESARTPWMGLERGLVSPVAPCVAEYSHSALKDRKFVFAL